MIWSNIIPYLLWKPYLTTDSVSWFKLLNSFLYLGFFLTCLLLVGLQSNHVFFRLCRARPTISMDQNLALTRARRAPWALCEGITERTLL